MVGVTPWDKYGSGSADWTVCQFSRPMEAGTEPSDWGRIDTNQALC
jgi:hypothetical protein